MIVQAIRWDCFSHDAFSCLHLASSTNVERSSDWFASKNCTAFDFIRTANLMIILECATIKLRFCILVCLFGLKIYFFSNF